MHYRASNQSLGSSQSRQRAFISDDKAACQAHECHARIETRVMRRVGTLAAQGRFHDALSFQLSQNSPAHCVVRMHHLTCKAKGCSGRELSLCITRYTPSCAAVTVINGLSNIRIVARWTRRAAACVSASSGTLRTGTFWALGLQERAAWRHRELKGYIHADTHIAAVDVGAARRGIGFTGKGRRRGAGAGGAGTPTNANRPPLCFTMPSMPTGGDETASQPHKKYIQDVAYTFA